MTYKIVSFGDSFVFGSELTNNDDGNKSWIGLAAKKLQVTYNTFATPGCGNDHIARQIYSYFSKNSVADTLAVINWTWASRWDFYLLKEIKIASTYDQIPKSIYETMSGVDWPLYDDFVMGAMTNNKKINSEIDMFVKSFLIAQPGKWFTLGPTCVPEKLHWINDDNTALQILEFYNNFVKPSILFNNFRNLQTINAVQYFLEKNNINCIQTFMDYEIFNIDENLSDDSVLVLQKNLKDKLESFHNGHNFLEWARSLGYAVTPSPGDHPLEEAHEAACDLWIQRYQNKLFN